MQLLADESVDKQIVDLLRDEKMSVLYILESSPGISDSEVLNMAKGNNLPILTADKDFGELIYRQKLTVSGVILIRLFGLPSTSKGSIVLNAIKKYPFGDNLFMVISPGLIRTRKM